MGNEVYWYTCTEANAAKNIYIAKQFGFEKMVVGEKRN